ncbi:MAG: N-formylglutamate amidohydrolase [Myxococcales bacterium]|nr:N-formylglutamate amidohydrolase [Myxococcales bacterium]
MRSDPEGEAYARRRGDPRARVLLSCEHASSRLPPGWAWHAEDRHLRDQHWALDRGAAALTHELAERLDATAVLACFSRLLVDANRPEDSEDLFLREADGHRLRLNERIESEERRRRLERYHRPYHAAIDRELGGCAAEWLLAIHSFSPSYQGEVREMEIGILFDEEEEAASRLALSLEAAGLRVALNEPYSGKDGLMYSAERHARRHGRRPLELEIRQDRAIDPAFRRRLVALLASALPL